MISNLKEFIFRPEIFWSLILVAVLAYFLVKLFGINLREDAKKAIVKNIETLMTKDKERTYRREQLEKIGKIDSKWKLYYRTIVQSMINALELHLSVENITSIAVVLYIIISSLFAIVFDSLILGFMIGIPSIFAIISTILVATKNKIRAMDNMVMDALDILCPTIHVGVVNSIKRNIDAFDPKIRKHFDNFLNQIENQGFYFPEAMDELNKKLGPKFDEFAKKAKIFEYYEKEGMAEVFRDIVDDNKINRTINNRMDSLFQTINREMVFSILIIVGFLVYMHANSMTGEFMTTTGFGKFTTALSVGIIIIIYSLSLFIQVDIDFNKVNELLKKKKEKKS